MDLLHVTLVFCGMVILWLIGLVCLIQSKNKTLQNMVVANNQTILALKDNLAMVTNLSGKAPPSAAKREFNSNLFGFSEKQKVRIINQYNLAKENNEPVTRVVKKLNREFGTVRTLSDYEAVWKSES